VLHGHMPACGQNCQAAVGHLAPYSCHPACLHQLPGHNLIMHPCTCARTRASDRHYHSIGGHLATAPRNNAQSSRALLLLHYMGKHLHNCLPLLCSHCLLPTHTPAPAHPVPWVALLLFLVNLPSDVQVNQCQLFWTLVPPPHTRWLVARHVSTYTATAQPLHMPLPLIPHPYASITPYLCPVLSQVKAMLCCVVSQCCLRAGQHSGGTEQTGGGIIITITLVISTCAQEWMGFGCSAAGRRGAPRPWEGGGLVRRHERCTASNCTELHALLHM
jgi:hypothetical protein